MHRLPRISPDLAIQYGDYTVPAGVSIAAPNQVRCAV